MRAGPPLLLRCPILAALCIPIVVLSGCQSQPPPLYAWAKGRADITPIKKIDKTVIALPTATENQLLSSPSQQVDDQFGASLAMTLHTLVVGAPGTANGGAAWVFDLADASAPPVKLTPPNIADGDGVGTSVAISDSGRYIAVGAPFAQVEREKRVGVVHVWEFKENAWTFVATFSGEEVPANSMLGSSVAIGDDTLLAGAPFTDVDKATAHGIVVTWMRDQVGVWSESITMHPDSDIPNARFGGAMSLKGTYLIVGASHARAADQTEGGIAYIYQRRQSGWSIYPACKIEDIGSLSYAADSHVNFDRGPANHFGWAVSILGNAAIVGSPENTEGSVMGCGSAAIFRHEESTLWTRVQYLSAIDKKEGDAFGSAVGIAGTQFAIGAPLRSEGGPVKSESDLMYEGAAYVYQLVPESMPPAHEFVIKLVASHPRSNGRLGAIIACTTDLIVVSSPGAMDHSTPGQVLIYKRTERSWGVPNSKNPPIKMSPDVDPDQADPEMQGEKPVPSSTRASSL